MAHYVETFSDPDFGTIAVVRDGKDGPVIATAVDPVRTCHNHGDNVVAAQCAEHDLLAEKLAGFPGWPDIIAGWERGWIDPSDR